MSGYRLIKETVDVFEDVAEVLESYGYEKDEVKDMLDTFSTDVEDGYEKGMTASEIADMVSGLQKNVDESYIYEGKSRGKSDKFAHSERAAYKKKKKSYEECDDCDDDDDLDESIEDVPGLTREPRGQVGADDWSDFKDDFRAKTLLLKKALTPKFVSELIKKTDFEIDEKEIKSYAFDVIENANLDAKNPVDALQRKLRRHFTGI